MEFLKKHKKAVLIIIGLIAVIGIIVWWYRRQNSEATAETDVWGVKKSPYGTTDVGKKIEEKTVQIMNNEEWYNKILANYQSQGYTLQQALAINAIWALKVDGEIPVDTYGRGEWGHIEYVKKNF